MKLFPYQETGAAFLGTAPAALLADQPGLGKTPQAIMAARTLFERMPMFSRAPNICVIAPKTALTNWLREWDRWWPGCLCKPTIINYDLLSITSDTRDRFKKTLWDLIICDEAHRLKSPGAARTKTVYGTIKALRAADPGHEIRVWLLTGTPSRNHAGELWTHLRALRPDLIEDRSGRPMALPQFEDAYCQVQVDRFGNRVIRGSKNMAELRDRLVKGGFMLRRLKSEVQAELPDLIFDDFPLSIDRLPVSAPAMAELGISDDTPMDAVITALRQHTPHMSTERRLTGLLKAPFIGQYVTDELDAPGKIIVFYHHTEVGDLLRDRLLDFMPARVDGKTRDAQAEVDRFQTDPDCRVFLGQIVACGEALNITAATQVLFAEAAWSPADNYQAACRAHRIGMGDNLTVRFLSLPGTVDAIIQRVLARKTAELAELFD